MAKGEGWMMAEGFGFLNTAHLAGTWEICPVCGGYMSPDRMVGHYKCQHVREDDMPAWLRSALERAHFEPWAYYSHDRAIDVLATAPSSEEGQVVTLVAMRDRGNFGGWQWTGAPVGGISWNIAFEEADRLAYIKGRWEGWQAKLAELLQNSDVVITQAELESEHPSELVKKATNQIELAEKNRQKVADREAKRSADQLAFDKELKENGFFIGRMGSADFPEDSSLYRVISSMSAGSKNNPHMLIANTAQRSLTVEKLTALVNARGNYSRVEVRGRQIVIISPEPGQWIGRGGATVKALGIALGQYVKVEEGR